MLDNFIIIGLVMTVVEIIKEVTKLEKKDYGKLVIPVLVFVFAGAFNVVNASLFGDVSFIEALKEGLILGASSGGIYSMGKVYIDKAKGGD